MQGLQDSDLGLAMARSLSDPLFPPGCACSVRQKGRFPRIAQGTITDSGERVVNHGQTAMLAGALLRRGLLISKGAAARLGFELV
jgi:hypothetical protein